MRLRICYWKLGTATALAIASSSVAASGALNARTYMDAANELLLRDPLPRKSDPATARWLETVTDVQRVLGSGPYEASNMISLMAVCSMSVQLASRYTLEGFDQLKPLANDKVKLSAALVKLQTENAVTYQDELSGIMAFSVACMSREVAPMNEFLASLSPEQLTPIRRQGAAQMRDGIRAAILGNISLSGDVSISVENRKIIVSALAANIDALATSLPEDFRRYLVGVMEAQPSVSDADIRRAMSHITEVLRKQGPCNGVCGI